MAISLPMVVGEAVWPWVRDSIGTSAYSSARLRGAGGWDSMGGRFGERGLRIRTSFEVAKHQQAKQHWSVADAQKQGMDEQAPGLSTDVNIRRPTGLDQGIFKFDKVN